jgi:molybdopterin-guanine dinucleotide biosynthesis protein A
MNGEDPIAEASAIVLAGGRSSRMGSPKALLPIYGTPLILHIIRALRRRFADILIVAAPDQELPPLPARIVRDEVAYQGPLGGLYYGLRAARGNVSFVISCDVVFINLPLISHLIEKMGRFDVVVPTWQGRLQPLHAVYRSGLAALAKRLLDLGELRPVSLYDMVPTLKTEEEEIRQFDPEGLCFFNINTPDDYQAALARWRVGAHNSPAPHV